MCGWSESTKKRKLTDCSNFKKCLDSTKKLVYDAFKICKLLLAFLGFESFSETQPFLSLWSRFCTICEFNQDICYDRRNYNKVCSLDLSESSKYFNKCGGAYKCADIRVVFEKQPYKIVRVIHLVNKSYTSFCYENYSHQLYENRNSKTDAFDERNIGKNTFYDYGHTTLVDANFVRWDSNFPSLPTYKKVIFNSWESNFPSIIHTDNTPRSKIWHTKFTPRLSKKEYTTEDFDSVLMFSNDLSTQVMNLDSYYNFLLYTVREDFVDVEDIRKKIKKFILTIHEDKSDKVCRDIQSMDPNIFVYACKQFVSMKGGMDNIVKSFRIV
tara:strand:- start:1384 stop:2361 length:978 start_codon:yes stop_codon:yes gene_type:complete